MKTLPTLGRPRRAFTLIELITVIAIIAILMGLLFAVLGPIRNTARKAKARTVGQATEHACKLYVQDYGRFPSIPSALVGGTADSNASYSYGDTGSGKCRVSNRELFDVLRAISRGANESHALNKRRQIYFEQPNAIDPRSPREGFVDGKQFPAEMQGQLLDPWGKEYCIVLDGDGDGLLEMNAFFQDMTEPLRRATAVFSMAADSEIGGSGYRGRLRKEGSNEAPDDVVSWE